MKGKDTYRGRPTILYKYRPLNDRTEELLTKRVLYFPSITEINDPFDCRVLLNRNATSQKLWRWLRKKLVLIYNTNDPVELVFRWFREPNLFGEAFTKEMAIEFIKSKKWKQFDPNNRTGCWNIINQRETNVRMFCLSAVNDDILMWSHYAQNHRGICLGFDIDSNPIFEKTTRVRYARKYPRADYYKVSDQKYYDYSLLTKSDHWNYEKEWRLLLSNTAGLKNPVYHFEASFLKIVIFGCQMTDSEKELTMEWLSVGGLKPTLYCAQPSEKEYKLRIVTINEI